MGFVKSVKTSYKGWVEVLHRGWFTNQVIPIYNCLSSKPPHSPILAPKALWPFVRQVVPTAQLSALPTPLGPAIGVCPRGAAEGVVLGFSGGKDSVATALIIKSHGYSPILYHVVGLNRSLRSELKAVQTLSKILKMPLVVAEVKHHGKFDYKESPIKDQLLLAMMLDYGMDRGITHYSMGLEKEARFAISNIDYNWSDCVEMFDAFNPWVAEHFPKYQWQIFLECPSQSYATISMGGKKLLEHCISCCSPDRFRQHWRKETMQKYKVELLPNRCGRCYKCCWDYLNWCALGNAEIVPKYLAYVFDRLRATLFQVMGQDYSQATDIEILKIVCNDNWVDTSEITAAME